MEIIVTGGRDYANRARVYAILDFVHQHDPITLLNHGGAQGADRLASDWAASRGVSECVHHADWKGLGPCAGPKRNQDMVDHGAQMAIAFPGGKGTADCVWRCKRARIDLFEVPDDEPARR